MGDSAYSFSLTTFSRTGKLLQIEYALNAVANGRTSLGICAKDGVVIATDKKLSSELVDASHVHKVELLTPSSGVCYAGVGPDYRVLGEFKDSAAPPRFVFHYGYLSLTSLISTFYRM
jgi:20S proteasome subunit alpha 2